MGIIGRHRESSVDEELRLHLERMIEENEARGMSHEQAREDAERRFGDLSHIREACVKEDEMAERSRRRVDRAMGWGQDIRYGLRMLWRSPLYALVIVVTLGFGIGANATVFSALAPYFLRDLPYADADRLVHLYTINTQAGWDRDRFSIGQMEDLRARSRGFESLGGYYYASTNLSGDGAAEQATVGRLTANAFEVLGATPSIGRTFAPDEGGPAGADVVVLSWGLWQRRFGGDGAVIGQTIRLDGEPHTVIGVMPAEFNFPFGGVKLWTPMRDDASTTPRDARPVLVFGRLAGGWTLESAREDLAGVWRDLSAEYPDIDGQRAGINVLGMRESLNFAYDILRIAFTALTGAVLFVLLVACANIVGLGLARAFVRRREVAVRSALGASRSRLLRQFLVESAILASIGGALGLLLAHVAMRMAGPVFPEDLFAIGEFGVDGTVILFTAAVTLMAALIIGVAPALSVTSTRPGDALREGGRSGAAGVRSSRLRSALVIGELALGLVLVVGAGLMTRSLSRATDVDLGFEPDGLLTVELMAPAAAYPDIASYAAYYRRVADAVTALPGVESASTGRILPLNHETPMAGYVVPGDPAVSDPLPMAESFPVGAGWIEALGIERLEGRDFQPADFGEGERVVMVNRTFADRHYGGSAVGQTVRLESGDSLMTLRIVGVVADVRHSSLTEPPPPQVYLPVDRTSSRRRFLVARVTGDPASLAASIRNAVAGIDPDIPANRLRPMRDIVLESVGPFAAMSIVLAVFGGFSLLLAAIGLYGLIAYSVSQRQTEFGVRMALGAAPRELVRGVVSEGVKLAGAGIVVGLLFALVAGRVLGSLLFGVSATDPVTFGLAAAVFLGCAMLATAVPALRASRSDPVSALRQG